MYVVCLEWYKIVEYVGWVVLVYLLKVWFDNFKKLLSMLVDLYLWYMFLK